MAQRRSASEGPPQPNPFWSERAALDFDVRMARPTHLPAEQSLDNLPPVPRDEWEGEENKDLGQDPISDEKLTEEVVGGRAKAWSRRGKGGSAVEFKTPPSGGLKSNRPTGEVKDLGPIKTEGPMPWRGDTPNRSAVESDAKAGLMRNNP